MGTRSGSATAALGASRWATGSLLALAVTLLCGGCTTVKFVMKNPYTAEVWTVYEHTFGSDTIVYCPPVENASCVEATIQDGTTTSSPPRGAPGNSDEE